MFVDVQSALDELGLDKEDFEEFVQELKSFTDEELPKLRGVVQGRDFTEIRAQAHALKGALANLRFVEAAEFAKKLESAGRESLDDGLEELLEGLEKSLVASYNEIGM